jgi:hypothetical protein
MIGSLVEIKDPPSISPELEKREGRKLSPSSIVFGNRQSDISRSSPPSIYPKALVIENGRFHQSRVEEASFH